MIKIAKILDDIQLVLEKKSFIPSPLAADPNSNPELGQMYQQVQQLAQSLPPDQQQQLQQQLQQMQQLPEQQQQHALTQITQQLQSQGPQPGSPSVPPGQDPSQGGQPQSGQDPNAQAQGQPSSGGGNEPGSSQLSALDQQTVTLTLADLLNLVTQGKHSQTTAKIHSSKQDAELQSQMLAMKHQEKIEDFKAKQQEKALQEQQQAAMQQQQNSATNLMGSGGIYPQQGQSQPQQPMQ